MAEAVLNLKGIMADYFQATDARCPSCTYSLRGCQSDRCPECGAGLALCIDSPRTGSGWWWAGVLGSAVSVGMSLVLLFPSLQVLTAIVNNPFMQAQVRAGITPMSALPNWTGVWVLAAVTAAACTMLGWMISRRHTFGRRSNSMMASVGILGAASPLIVLLVINRLLAWM